MATVPGAWGHRAGDRRAPRGHPARNHGRGALGVRFGEVEARGIALTATGRDLYEHLVREVDARVRDHPERVRQDVAAEVWSEEMPGSEDELCRRGLAFFTYALADATRRGTR